MMRQEKRKNAAFSEELSCWPTSMAAPTPLYFHDKDVFIILQMLIKFSGVRFVYRRTGSGFVNIGKNQDFLE